MGLILRGVAPGPPISQGLLVGLSVEKGEEGRYNICGGKSMLKQQYEL